MISHNVLNHTCRYTQFNDSLIRFIPVYRVQEATIIVTEVNIQDREKP